jgi:hypothetical protein
LALGVVAPEQAAPRRVKGLASSTGSWRFDSSQAH